MVYLMPKVSIIVPVYNTQRYLHECIKSLINQTYKDIEIILVDDGSTDKSGSICDGYAKQDKRVKIFHISNCGLAHARNIGIDNVTGEYILFQDSDDYIELNMIKEMVNEAHKNNSDLIICGYRKFFEKPEKVIIEKCYNKINYLNRKDFLNDFYKYFPISSNTAWGKLYNTKTIKENEIKFIKGLSLIEDLMFNSKYYSKIDRIIVLNNVYCNYRQVKDSLAHKFTENVFDLLDIYFKEIKALLSNNCAFNSMNRKLLKNNSFSRCIGEICHYITFNRKSILSNKINKVREYMNKEIVVESGKHFKSKGIWEIILTASIMKKAPFLLIVTITFKDFLKKIFPQLERIIL
jgi:glycosyltransferase involved in cell wall biosynthesis